ncbi:MAG: Tyrosine recombinase XerC [Legionella sp.]|uniref:tyrosine-type recombinase/integrase n=1 Tax=Legionella sp. TaxID=459 RepID=UPI003D141E69
MDDNKLLSEQFKLSLIKQDLSASSIKGYLYDLNYFLLWMEDFYQWAKQAGLIQSNPSETINFARKMSPTKPEALNKVDVHVLLTAAGKSSHGLDKRNYALVQLLLQAGLRIGEVTSLQLRNITIRDRSGSVSVVDGKGRKHRDVPLNATGRRAISSYLQTKDGIGQEDYLFTNKSGAPLSIRALQKVIKSLAAKR